tara:strand:+ start:1176 stop:1529 length:354 start_codon:yes stop_codon:yes gene_type:complete
MPQRTLVEIKKVDTAFEAYAIKGFLENHDIACFIADEYLINADWALKQALGDVRLNIYEQDYDKAKQLLDETQDTKPQRKPPPKQPWFNTLISLFLTLLFAVPVPLKKKHKKNKEHD